jgi:hypothetical protein
VFLFLFCCCILAVAVSDRQTVTVWVNNCRAVRYCAPQKRNITIREGDEPLRLVRDFQAKYGLRRGVGEHILKYLQAELSRFHASEASRAFDNAWSEGGSVQSAHTAEPVRAAGPGAGSAGSTPRDGVGAPSSGRTTASAASNGSGGRYSYGGAAGGSASARRDIVTVRRYDEPDPAPSASAAAPRTQDRGRQQSQATRWDSKSASLRSGSVGGPADADLYSDDSDEGDDADSRDGTDDGRNDGHGGDDDDKDDEEEEDDDDGGDNGDDTENAVGPRTSAQRRLLEMTLSASRLAEAGGVESASPSGSSMPAASGGGGRGPPLFNLDIDVGGGRFGRIVVHKGDSVQLLAEVCACVMLLSL